MKKSRLLFLSLLSWVLMIVFMGLVLPYESNRLFESTRVNGSPDTSFIFSVSDLEDLIRAYGEEGRMAYVESRIRFDIIWPVVYTAALVFPLLFFTRNHTQKKWWILPLIAMGFDLLENTFASILMLQFPLFSRGLAIVLIMTSFLKWVFLGISFIVLIGFITVRLFYRNQHQKGQSL